MLYLNDATSGWSNIPSLNEIYSDIGGNYTQFEILGKARLPKKSEIPKVGTDFDSYLWLFNYLTYSANMDRPNKVDQLLGYWTLDSHSQSYVWVMSSRGLSLSSASTLGSIGVRPVITVSKSDLS